MEKRLPCVRSYKRKSHDYQTSGDQNAALMLQISNGDGTGHEQASVEGCTLPLLSIQLEDVCCVLSHRAVLITHTGEKLINDKLASFY